MRRLTLGLALLAACASPGVPPGGPVDEEPPVIVRLRPDTNAVNVRSSGLDIAFDEVISERPQGGATTLADLFLISPSRGRNELEWHRTRLAVRPRGGFKPNTTYRVTMLPGLVDLDGNMDSVGKTIVFSTGPAIASGRISGRVFDWMDERVARSAMVEAIVLPDSTHYVTMADSVGHYELRNMPPGQYVLRGIADQNRNRELDPRELYDTISVTLEDSLTRPLHMIPRDTLGPGIERVEIVDSLTLRLRFDRALDTSLAIVPSLITIKRADSSVVPFQRVIGGRAFKKEREDSARAKALQDSIRQANDTSRKADSVRAAARARAAATPPRPPPARGRPPIDTTPPPKPTVRIPEIELIVTLTAPIPPGTSFRVRAEGMRSIVGRTRNSERTQVTAKAKPPGPGGPAPGGPSGRHASAAARAWQERREGASLPNALDRGGPPTGKIPTPPAQAVITSFPAQSFRRNAREP